MVNYTCPTCQKVFSKKYNFEMHTKNKKKPCQRNLQEFAENLQDLQDLQEFRDFKESHGLYNQQISHTTLKNKKDTYYCAYCIKDFSSVYTLNRHMENSCKAKKNHETELKEENKQLKSQIDKQAKEIEDLKKMFAEFSKSNKRNSKTSHSIGTQNNTDNSINTNNSNNNTSIQNNQNINIILPYGQELEKIQLDEVLDHMLTLDFKDMLQNFVKYIYLNDSKPENKNFVVNDIARNKCQYYDGKKWITGRANDEILKIFENTNSLLTDPFDRVEIEKTIEFIRKNKKYSEKYNTILKCKNYALSLFDESDKENMEKREELLKELKLIFYSHKDEILKINL